jgi:hypothetical protein
VKEGGKVLVGGKRIGEQGYYFEPTIIAVDDNKATIAQEEIFGPVQCIFKWNNMDEVSGRKVIGDGRDVEEGRRRKGAMGGRARKGDGKQGGGVDGSAQLSVGRCRRCKAGEAGGGRGTNRGIMYSALLFCRGCIEALLPEASLCLNWVYELSVTAF